MAEDAELTTTAGPGGPTPAPATPVLACPWCSAPLPGVEATACASCGARLVEEDVSAEIPGVTAVDRGLLAAAAAPRRAKRTFGSLLVGGDDDEIPPPSEAEMPALAPPDLDVRREMLRLELEARLTGLRAEVQAMEAEERVDAGLPPLEPSDAPEPSEAPEPGDAPEPGEGPASS